MAIYELEVERLDIPPSTAYEIVSLREAYEEQVRSTVCNENKNRAKEGLSMVELAQLSYIQVWCRFQPLNTQILIDRLAVELNEMQSVHRLLMSFFRNDEPIVEDNLNLISHGKHQNLQDAQNTADKAFHLMNSQNNVSFAQNDFTNTYDNRQQKKRIDQVVKMRFISQEIFTSEFMFDTILLHEIIQRRTRILTD